MITRSGIAYQHGGSAGVHLMDRAITTFISEPRQQGFDGRPHTVVLMEVRLAGAVCYADLPSERPRPPGEQATGGLDIERKTGIISVELSRQETTCFPTVTFISSAIPSSSTSCR